MNKEGQKYQKKVSALEQRIESIIQAEMSQMKSARNS